MDLLPSVSDPVYPLPTVPLLCHEEFDGLEFSSYPARRGWEVARLLCGDFGEKSPDETVAFLQTWLYFGVLSEIIGPSNRVKMCDFSKEGGDGRKYVTTIQLLRYLEQWVVFVESRSEKDLGEYFWKVGECLRNLCGMCDILYRSVTCPLPAEVLLSVMVLGSTIDHALFRYWKIPSQRHWGLRDIATSRMLDAGWCLRDVAFANDFLPEMGVFYASSIRRDFDGQDHSQCSERTCLINQIDESQYRTKHTSDNCTCRHVEPPQETIRNIIRQGEVPVLSLTTKTLGDGSRHLDVSIKSFSKFR
jgi:hypothetical protein